MTEQLALSVRTATEAAGHDVIVRLDDPQVTVQEVFDTLSLPADTPVDGALVTNPGAVPARSVLRAGSRLGPGLSGPVTQRPAGSNEAAGPAGVVEAAIVAGLNAGRIEVVAPGVHHDTLGTGQSLQVRTTPGGPSASAATDSRAPWHANRARIEAVAAGDQVVALGPSTSVERAQSTTIHRPPRVAPPTGAVPIGIPDLPGSVPAPQPLSWATLLAPIPIALLMAFFFRPLFALFAAMGPIMALGRWVESRRRFRKATRDREQALLEIEGELTVAVARYREQIAQVRWACNPHIGELWRRADQRSVRLWERRRHSSDFLVLTAGVGPDSVSVQTTDVPGPDPVFDVVRRPVGLRAVPHSLDLGVARGVGIHGPRDSALALARSLLLQVATLHGPADVEIGLLVSATTTASWDWIKWLPHTRQALCGRRANEVAAALGPPKHVPSARRGVPSPLGVGAEGQPTIVIVVDDPSADVAALVRVAASSDVELRVIAVAETATTLPAICSSAIGVDPTAGHRATLTTPARPGSEHSIFATGVSPETATAWARALAPLVDPESRRRSPGGQDSPRLLQLLELDSAHDVRAAWQQLDSTGGIVATLGVHDDGTAFTTDLACDGPHALIAGTTGSGKSELLRTLVLSVAAHCPPNAVNFVLVDFKGGGAFDAVAGLPHTVGVITDLDESLVNRAIVSLRTELQRREQLLRELGVSSFEHLPPDPVEPLARLIVVVDEFAVLATDHPELMASIVDLAARGRSLGMHLVLATQRPSGVVDQKIRANTNLRVALRVQDPYDSQDVIGVPDAAHLDRSRPGRAVVSIGGDRPTVLQAAFTGAARASAGRCSVHPHQLLGTAGANLDRASDTESCEMTVLIDWIVQAAGDLGRPARPLWSPPLPDSLAWSELMAGEHPSAVDTADSRACAGALLGLADLPGAQHHGRWRWSPATGPLAVFGASADHVANAVVSLGASLTTHAGPDQLHLYVIDAAGGATGALATLPHCGAHVRQFETDRIERTLRHVESTLRTRRSASPTSALQPTMQPTHPDVVLIIDNLESLLAGFDDLRAAEVSDRLAALARDGSAHGVHLVVTVRSARELRHRLAQHFPNRLVMELSDPSGYLSLGLRAKEVPRLEGMRAIDTATKQVVQIVEPPPLGAWVNDGAGDGGPVTIGSFPDLVEVSELDAASSAGDALCVPVGIESESLDQAAIVVHRGDHVLLVGASGMGRSSTLLAIGQTLDQSADGPALFRVVPRRSPLGATGAPGGLLETAEDVAAVVASGERSIVLVDDAGAVARPVADALARIAADPASAVHIIAATTFEGARSALSWTTALRPSGLGAMLGGGPADGELFKVRLGRLAESGTRPGRGHLVCRGRVQQVQFARPSTGD